MFKFYSFNENNLTAFENYSAWFSKPIVFNDPFEGIYIDDTKNIDDNELIRFFRSNKNNKRFLELFDIRTDVDTWLTAAYTLGQIKNIKQEINERNTIILQEIQKRFYKSGVCCFIMDVQSPPIKNNLMWGHYGNGLKGFALKVNTNPEDVFEDELTFSAVSYSDIPPKINASEIMLGMIKDEQDSMSNEAVDLVLKVMNTKHTHWGYENELRFISTDEGNTPIKYKRGAIESLFIGERMLHWQKVALYHIAKGHNIKNIFEAYVNKASYSVGIRPFVLP